ncbi:MAG TPA: uroporphyrinogen decarboxylase [Alphaproteobacteria bacterium]|nr:uroporphyrinogen decarboxylase [Alphaproteobacteria bacterium]
MTEKLLLKALQGQPTQRVPFWFMRQAGRYLPEYRELRASKGGFLNLVYDPKAACEITLQPIRRFQMDGAILFSDILVIPQALGQTLEFTAGEGPQLGDLNLASLKPENIHQTLSPIYETVSNIRAGLTSEGFHHTTLIGFAGSPYTLACYMIEGHGSKDFGAAKHYALQNPANFSSLIDILVEATISYLSAQVKAGAEALQLFESWSSMADAQGFEDWIIKPTARIIRQLRALHPDIPIIGFPKGAGAMLGRYAKETGIQGLGIDSLTPLNWAAEQAGPAIILQGNLDPWALAAGGEAMKSRARAILGSMKNRPFIFNLGHGIDKSTPVEHVEALARIVQEY